MLCHNVGVRARSTALPGESSTAFVSYSRVDAEEFALRLAEDLKKAGASIWLDQLELEPGKPWDTEIERALATCPRMLAILSPRSVSSANVLDEVNYALRRGKTVIPVLYLECDIPFRLDRLERIGFRTNYDRGLARLLKTLGVQAATASANQAAPADVFRQGYPVGAQRGASSSNPGDGGWDRVAAAASSRPNLHQLQPR